MTTDTTVSFDHAIALTGGIATGKSTVASMLADDGFAVIDADRISHQILDEQSERVGEMFGTQLIQEGAIDRKALGAIVFADEHKRRELERLLHPLIQKEIERQSDELERLGKLYFVDIPLFYERGAYAIDRVLVVYAPRELQIKRMMLRDGLTRTQATQRLDAQIDIESKKSQATHLIDNSSDLDHLYSEYKKVIESI